jgi:ribosome-binding factor A
MTGRHANRATDRVHRILAQLLGEELRDPRVGFVTLTEVKLSPDRRQALAFVTIMDRARQEASLDALNHAAPYLRRMLARRAGLRFTPELKFLADDVIESGQRLERLFDEMRETWRREQEEH